MAALPCLQEHMGQSMYDISLQPNPHASANKTGTNMELHDLHKSLPSVPPLSPLQTRPASPLVLNTHDQNMTSHHLHHNGRASSAYPTFPQAMQTRNGSPSRQASPSALRPDDSLQGGSRARTSGLGGLEPSPLPLLTPRGITSLDTLTGSPAPVRCL